MLLVLVLDLIDYTIVAIANPSIQHGFGSGSTVLEWVTAGYGLAYGLGLVSGGRLGDVFGRRRMFLVGVAGFTMASGVLRGGRRSRHVDRDTGGAGRVRPADGAAAPGHGAGHLF